MPRGHVACPGLGTEDACDSKESEQASRRCGLGEGGGRPGGEMLGCWVDFGVWAGELEGLVGAVNTD